MKTSFKLKQLTRKKSVPVTVNVLFFCSSMLLRGPSERPLASKKHQVDDEKCAQQEIFDGQEKRKAQTDDNVPRTKGNAYEDDFEQLVQELELVERETGLKDALLFLEFDKYYNSWNKPLN